MEFRSFDGTRLNVTEVGDGPAVLLLHGDAALATRHRNRLN